MPQIRVDIIIPLFYNNGKPIPDYKLTKTLDELTDRFGGGSRDDSIIEGRWVETVGRKKVYFRDKNRSIWVVCDDSAENRYFFSEYKKRLEVRYQQRSIFILITGNVSIVS
ncbi:MAG TPA: hypothetical protein VKA09_01280 [Nitrososphaeraceae archaeon]|nr:hypothetical protein [Nitrososphaeraceae archaeon]